MKKIFIYFFLFLILTSCSENKVKKALESCTDVHVLNDLRDGKMGYSYPGVILANFGDFPKADDLINRSWELQERVNKKSDEFQPWLKKNLKQNIYTNRYEVIIHEGTVEALLPIGHPAILEYKDKIMKKYKGHKSFMETNQAHVYALRKRGYDLYATHGINILHKASLNKKMKDSTYGDFFIECEKKYNETPNAFLLKWE